EQQVVLVAEVDVDQRARKTRSAGHMVHGHFLPAILRIERLGRIQEFTPAALFFFLSAFGDIGHDANSIPIIDTVSTDSQPPSFVHFGQVTTQSGPPSARPDTPRVRDDYGITLAQCVASRLIDVEVLVIGWTGISIQLGMIPAVARDELIDDGTGRTGCAVPDY